MHLKRCLNHLTSFTEGCQAVKHLERNAFLFQGLGLWAIAGLEINSFEIGGVYKKCPLVELYGPVAAWLLGQNDALRSHWYEISRAQHGHRVSRFKIRRYGSQANAIANHKNSIHSLSYQQCCHTQPYSKKLTLSE